MCANRVAPAPPFPDPPPYLSNNEPAPALSAMPPPPPYEAPPPTYNSSSPAASSVNPTIPPRVVPASNSAPRAQLPRAFNSPVQVSPLSLNQPPIVYDPTASPALAQPEVPRHQQSVNTTTLSPPRSSSFISTSIAPPISGGMQYSQTWRGNAAPVTQQPPGMMWNAPPASPPGSFSCDCCANAPPPAVAIGILVLSSVLVTTWACTNT